MVELTSIPLASCGLFDCSDQIIDEAISESNRYIATAFSWNCGATTSFATIVNIRGASEAFDPESQSVVLSVIGQYDVTLDWIDGGILEVTLADVVETALEAKIKVEKLGDLRINYIFDRLD